jgi:hypothetical protein
MTVEIITRRPVPEASQSRTSVNSIAARRVETTPSLSRDLRGALAWPFFPVQYCMCDGRIGSLKIP